MAVKVYGSALPIECVNHIKNIWMVTWSHKNEEDGKESFIYEIFDHKPSLSEIKEVILTWYNTKIDTLILSGFTWKDMPVWLSMENQFNYKAAYDIAVQSDGKVLPTFKFGTVENPVYYKFLNMEDLQDFYLEAMTYVSEILAKGWAKKDSIDWSIYSKLLEEQ